MKKLIPFIALVMFSASAFAFSKKDVGVLVLAHGGDSLWNANITNAVKPLKSKYKVAVAFGMANPHSMQEGINKLEKQGVKTIVAVQLFVSSYSMIIRQNEYLLGFRDSLADPPLLMMHGMPEHTRQGHSSMAGHGGHHMAMSKPGEIKMKPIDIKANVLLTKPLNDHAEVINILLKRIKSESLNQNRETIILVAHGPNDNQDNQMWLSTLHNIAIQIKSSFGVHSFRNIVYLTLRDDAPKPIYNSAKEQFRGIVKKANENNGRALIVPVLLSKGGIEGRLEKRLKGLDYVWNGKTLLPDRRITLFIQQSIKEALSHQAIAEQ